MKIIIPFLLLFTFSLSAKTLDNKAFCEAMEQGNREVKLKSLLKGGTEITSDSILRIVRRKGTHPEYILECIKNDQSFTTVGMFWICSEINASCNKKQITPSEILAKLENNSEGPGDFVIMGIFRIIPSKEKEYFSLDDFGGFQAIAKIENLYLVSKAE